MSLHIGNLSSHTRRDDLERVFRRFGRCTIQVKDKYGFVVYDYPASAENALKTLRGTRIRGEAITISWSKMQPRALQRFPRGGKSYEPPRRRYSVKENSDRKPTSNDRQDYEMTSKTGDGGVRNIGSSDLVDQSISYHLDGSKGHLGERDHSSPSNHRGKEGSGKNHPEDDRWGEHIVDPSKENYLENGMEFDRYEPYQGDIKKDLYDHQSMEPSTSRNSQKVLVREDSRGMKIPDRGRGGNFRDKKGNVKDDENQDKNRLDRASSRSQSPRSLRSLSRAPSPSKLKSVRSKKISPSSNIRQKDTKVSVANAVCTAQSDRGASKYENIASAVDNECVDKLEQKDLKKDCSEKNNENCRSVTIGSCELLELHAPKLDCDDDVVGNLYLRSAKETRISQNEDPVGSAPESDISLRSNASNSARMSSAEIHMVLKHYGLLQYPEESEKDLSVGTYFGSARLWPWQVIFYRRLKKGPISAENYKRRIAQNQEFGIVDKYIRGSSGWGELNENNN